MLFIKVPGWEKFPWLRHGFSRRAGGVSTVYGGGSLNLGWTKDDAPESVAENRRLFAEAVAERPAQRMITLRQVHSAVTYTVREENNSFETPEGRALLEGDGLMTSQPGLLLGIQTADCVPVMVVDPESRAVAILHAGWRGTVAGIVTDGITQLGNEYGSKPENLIAAVGPSIGACCYAVGDEVRSHFHDRFSYADDLLRGDRLDLWEANRRQLVDAGVSPRNIAVVGECTGCARDDSGAMRYFSHRIEHGFTGRMMSIVGIAPI